VCPRLKVSTARWFRHQYVKLPKQWIEVTLKFILPSTLNQY
jgi:hypothetical protein